MAKIHTLKISNFRGIANFEQVFGMTDFICIIGRGDSGKTSILEAISHVLCGSWNLTFQDIDFYECNVDDPIVIEASLYDLPDQLLREDKFGLYIRGLDKANNVIHDDVEDHHENILTVRLCVEKDLEPKWSVVNGRQEPKEIRATDRAKLNAYLVSEYIDRHFSWNVGSPLYSLLSVEDGIDKRESVGVVIDALRSVKNNIDEESFNHLSPVIEKIKASASSLGVDVSNTSTSIDFKDFMIKDGRISLHDGKIPLRLKGKGSKRLISIAIQVELAKSGGILLIDEIEQGLEPDRAQHLAKTLKAMNSGQIFVTTHSRDVLVELSAENLMRMKRGATALKSFDQELQGLLRTLPEVFFAERVLVCEGVTEVGICRALNNSRIREGKDNIATKGVRLADGKGSNQFNYAISFKKAGYDVVLFCDSDIPDGERRKNEIRELGVLIVDCDLNNATENQVFNDLPWAGILELLNHQTNTLNKSIDGSVKQGYKVFGDLAENWRDTDNHEIRSVLAALAGSEKWFKRTDHGEFLGEVCCKHLPDMEGSRLKRQFDELSNWIENA